MRQDARLKKMFEVLVEEHAPMLVSYLAALTGSRNDAEDLAQETFLKAYRKFDRFDGNTGNFAAWLRTVGKNVAIDRYRKSRRTILMDEVILEGVEGVFRAADEYGSGDTWSERITPLRECMARLSETLSNACTLFYFEGLRARDIAERLKVNTQTVLKRLERARTFLKECIEGKLDVEPVGVEHDA